MNGNFGIKILFVTNGTQVAAGGFSIFYYKLIQRLNPILYLVWYDACVVLAHERWYQYYLPGVLV